jgi:sterol desaturase/sphingolipid hydroxylase (fatty acid hydroxylase superfamily)
MELLADYFSNIPSAHRSAILIGGLTFFMLLETAAPMFQWDYRRWRHLGTNMVFTLTTVLVNFVMAGILLFSSDFVASRQVGVLQWLPSLPLWLEIVLGLLLLDLVGAWFVHWVQHKVRWMWRFHLIHHTDTHVDASSANRHHPGESVVRFVFTTLAVIVSGAPIYTVMLYQSMSAAMSQFNHANIHMPAWLNRSLGWLLVTPAMHRVHHHYRLPYTDSNYGNIFSLWDRLFGTYRLLDNDKITFGVDTHMDPAENDRLGNLMSIPFQPYRPASTPESGEG